jgi:hypothetical protein
VQVKRLRARSRGPDTVRHDAATGRPTCIISLSHKRILTKTIHPGAYQATCEARSPHLAVKGRRWQPSLPTGARRVAFVQQVEIYRPTRTDNARSCRDPRFGLSQIRRRTSVAHHPTEDTLRQCSSEATKRQRRAIWSRVVPGHRVIVWLFVTGWTRSPARLVFRPVATRRPRG